MKMLHLTALAAVVALGAIALTPASGRTQSLPFGAVESPALVVTASFGGVKTGPATPPPPAAITPETMPSPDGAENVQEFKSIPTDLSLSVSSPIARQLVGARGLDRAHMQAAKVNGFRAVCVPVLDSEVPTYLVHGRRGEREVAFLMEFPGNDVVRIVADGKAASLQMDRDGNVLGSVMSERPETSSLLRDTQPMANWGCFLNCIGRMPWQCWVGCVSAAAGNPVGAATCVGCVGWKAFYCLTRC